VLLTDNNIKSELSYAYLHALASGAGCECTVAGRHSDGAGVDAVIRAKERFALASIFTDFTIEVQLKATSLRQPMDDKQRWSFYLELKNYNALRNEKAQAQRLLVVLFMPENREEWLSHSRESLILRRCAFWVSLRGAPESLNETSQTVYIPRSNLLSVAALREVLARVSRNEYIPYEL
jgi:uncharacterized protein DUF4365